MRKPLFFLPMIVWFLGGCASRSVAPAPPAPAPPATAQKSTRSKPAPVLEPAPTDSVTLADLWERASRARAEGRYAEALKIWEHLWSTDPDYPGVAELLEEEYRVHGLDAFARGRTEEAIALWEKALRIDPEDRKTNAYLDHAREQQSRLGEIPGEASPSRP